jgi:hypothetical protein
VGQSEATSLSLSKIVEQIEQVGMSANRMRQQSERSRDESSRTFFSRQAEYYENLARDLEGMRDALIRIDARARDILSSNGWRT